MICEMHTFPIGVVSKPPLRRLEWDVYQHSEHYSVVVVGPRVFRVRAFNKNEYAGMSRGMMSAMAFEEDVP